METVEQEIQHGLYQSVISEDVQLSDLKQSDGPLERLIAYVGQNRRFYRIYLRKRNGVLGEEGFQHLWAQQLRPLFHAHGVESDAHMRYYFEYIKSGFISVTRLWLENGCAESPAEVAQILRLLLPARGI
ncbi:MAG: TetR family transcriptional regulator C-terminal domain-containing protein [Oscillospiraceae bacterium]|nr:TetR family transcriptional regulator C-terminal domain-containing protein [Oscillospiraceae bacterium]